MLSPSEAGRVLGQHRLQGSGVQGGSRVLSEFEKETKGGFCPPLCLNREGEISPKNRGCVSPTTASMGR